MSMAFTPEAIQTLAVIVFVLVYWFFPAIRLMLF